MVIVILILIINIITINIIIIVITSYRINVIYEKFDSRCLDLEQHSFFTISLFITSHL